jgi:DeoR/GlpR family transcriptional regulator of sugar metabolism
MLKIDRQKQILYELQTHGSVLISELSKKLECSEETIRRDLKEMEAKNKLRRVHGGAFLNEKNDKSVPIELRETFFTKEKKRIADHAVKYITENNIIMLDSSTTCLKLAQEIIASKINVTIITNSLRICNMCNSTSNNVILICIGGKLRLRTSSFTGYQTTDAHSSYIADKCFISCPSLDIKFGLADNNINESKVRECMLEHSREHFLVVDHTKFKNTSDVIFSDFNKIDTIITDSKLTKEWKDKCKQLDIKVDYC